jgi:hypothetical protein
LPWLFLLLQEIAHSGILLASLPRTPFGRGSAQVREMEKRQEHERQHEERKRIAAAEAECAERERQSKHRREEEAMEAQASWGLPAIRASRAAMSSIWTLSLVPQLVTSNVCVRSCVCAAWQ